MRVDADVKVCIQTFDANLVASTIELFACHVELLVCDLKFAFFFFDTPPVHILKHRVRRS